MRSSKSMAPFVRVQQGAMLAGVCSGLAARGNGTTTLWRLVFVVSTLVAWFPAIVYAGMAVALPQASSAEEAKRKSQITDGGGTPLPATGSLESELERLQKMRSEGLIEEEEYQQLRKKVLGL